MSQNVLVGCLAVLFLAACDSRAASTCSGRERRHRHRSVPLGGGYRPARTSNPFTLKIGDTVSARTRTSAPPPPTGASRRCSTRRLSRAPRTQESPPPRAASRLQLDLRQQRRLGVAQIRLSGAHISQGTVKLNDTYFNTAQYNTPAWRNLVSCQEVGHTFGLDHQDENFDNANLGTCMDYTNDPSTNQHPNQHDYDELETIYSHNDSSTTVGMFTPAAVAQLDDRRDWGTEVFGLRSLDLRPGGSARTAWS